MKITMKTIADYCGVSKSLVSRILNNDKTLRITSETREKVLNAIEQFGYIRDMNARSLVTSNLSDAKNFYRIGYVSFSSRKYAGHPYFSHIIEGIAEEAGRNNAIIAFHMPINDMRAQLSAVTAQFRDNPLDGLILLGKVDDKSLISSLPQIARYVLCVDKQFDYNCDYVGVDTVQSIVLAAKHLLDLGYTSFGIIYGSYNDGRLAACEGCLKKAGVSINREWVINGEYSVDVAKERTAKALAVSKPPRAIIACNDEMAFGCIKALKNSGYRIPQDVAIVGHDDISMAAYMDTPLTTVHIYKKEIGRFAVKILCDRIDTARRNTVQMEIPGKLIKRDSCGWKNIHNLRK